MNIVITGGAGFIGSHVVKLFVKKYPQYKIINVDALTYAGNLENVATVSNAPNYVFEKLDIRDENTVNQLFKKYNVDAVIHLAAESHVDRSIENPNDFVLTNVVGTVNLLNSAKNHWKNNGKKHLFYHISTDEVYGSLDIDGGYFFETTSYDPRSPYSASKASSDHFVRAYYHTYNLPVVLSNCSNNYGPFQYPEKLIPVVIDKIINNQPIPLYGKGINVRDWLYVEDHADAIDKIFHNGILGATYNIGGENECSNIQLVESLCKILDNKLGRAEHTSKNLISFVQDRAGHDLRYAINCDKIKNDLGWTQSLIFEEGLEKTVDWYLKIWSK